MKCAYCGKETKSEKVCGHCGKDLAPLRGVEVQYKDFKITELLDIKMPGQAPPPKESGKTDEGKATGRETLPGKEPGAEKRSRLRLLVAVILLAAVAGFVLLKLLIKF
jgi:hypothetical protein